MGFFVSNDMLKGRVMQIRQGDVLLESLKEIPAGFKFKSNDPIVAHGEVTGHCHEIVLDRPESVEMFVNERGEIVYNLPCTGYLKHQEHDKIILPKGVFLFTRQREYSPGAIKNVAD